MADLSALPSVEKLASQLAKSVSLPRPLINEFVRQRLGEFRTRLLAEEKIERAEIENAVEVGLRHFAAARLKPVINGTGVLIHTNLGRSPLGGRAAAALMEIATGYSNLEFDLPSGNRGKRAGYLETALACLLETEAATAVNNCAAALVLTLRTLMEEGKNEVIVSRSELVEIGGGFRVPDILETSGAKLVEVGATNKTNIDDYAKAVTEKTALILKVHRSNFYLGGFTGEPDIEELAKLCGERKIPLVEDLGSGAMMNTDDLAPIDHEPTPMEALRRGIDLVTFSGDKLLGGPQSGIIAGRADLVARIKKEPFFRAVRCDKLILATLQESIDEYLATKNDVSQTDVPILKFLTCGMDDLRKRAETLKSQVEDLPSSVEVVETVSRTGGGTMPKAEFPSIGLKITPSEISVEDFAEKLRTGQNALVGYAADGAWYCDMRTIFPAQDEQVLGILREAL
nr:L-seryl-tRNA(Sec) selenium transferase-like [Nerophis lumbriciformis]